MTFSAEEVRTLWLCGRKFDCSIPDESLDEMRDALLARLEQREEVTEPVEVVADGCKSCADWLRNNYQDYSNIADTCDAMLNASRHARQVPDGWQIKIAPKIYGSAEMVFFKGPPKIGGGVLFGVARNTSLVAERVLLELADSMLTKSPPAPPGVQQVPDVMVNVPYGACHSEEYETSYAKGWNDCRKEMLAAAPPAQERNFTPDWAGYRQGLLDGRTELVAGAARGQSLGMVVYHDDEAKAAAIEGRRVLIVIDDSAAPSTHEGE